MPLQYREIERRLKKIGYSPKRQSGSHVQFFDESGSRITVPKHKVVGRGLLRKIIRDTDMSVEDFIGL